jgi:hypothetical protein
MVIVTGDKDQKKIKDPKPIVGNIFKVYNFMLGLKDDCIMDHTDFQQKFLE